MDMNKHIVSEDKNKPWHSHGYARVASGNQLGSSSSISFDRRQQIENNRQVVLGYNRSSIGNGYSVAPRTRPVVDLRGDAPSSTPSTVNTPTNRSIPRVQNKYHPFS
jgi:hypothetical protein